jgi:hypothetical protein
MPNVIGVTILNTPNKRFANRLAAADLAAEAADLWIAEARAAIEREDWADAEKATAEAARANENFKAWTQLAREARR